MIKRQKQRIIALISWAAALWTCLPRVKKIGRESTPWKRAEASTELDQTIISLLRQALAQGHIGLLESEVTGYLTLRRQGLTSAVVWSTIQRLNLRGDIVIRNDTIALPRPARAEETIARCIYQIGKFAGGVAPSKFAEWIALEGEQLNDEQRAAVSVLSNSTVGILTGDPGTGKTVTVKALAAVLERAGYQISLAAPTGRAAARMAETSGRPAQTLHRLLHNSSGRQMLRGLTVSATLEAIIVDEASMLDLFLAERLFEYCTSRTKLILVGDVHQLPPVGTGQVFRDLIESRQVPVVALTQCFRQSEQSEILSAAKQIKTGIAPNLTSPAGAKSDCYFIEADSMSEIQRLVVNAATRSLPKRCGADPYRDIQILTPMRNGALGTNMLNRLVRSALHGNAGPSSESASGRFRANDRVLQTRNDYGLGVFNGECGVIEDVQRQGAVIRFGERRVAYPQCAFSSLTHGFASTIHRSQGSEYPFVIIPVHECQSPMMTRELLYTALTRGKRMVVFIGSRRAFGRAIGNAQNHRRTGLKNLLSTLPFYRHLRRAA